MKKTLRKFLTAGLALSLCLTALTACGKKDNKDQGQAVPAGEGMQINSEASPADKGEGQKFKPSDFGWQSQDKYEFQYAGISMSLPEKIREAMQKKDIIMLDDSIWNDKGGVKYGVISWNKMTEEQKNKELGTMGDEYPDWIKSLEKIGAFSMFEAGTSEEEISKITGCTDHKKLGQSSDGQYDYYLSTNKDSKSELKDEIGKIDIKIGQIEKLPENGYVFTEKNSSAQSAVGVGQEGSTSSNLGDLKTKTIEGKEYSLKEMGENELTMVNVFATWCGPCVKEIPELQKLSEEMKDKKVGIVGVVTDTVSGGSEDSGALAKAKEIKDKLKVTYPFLMPDKTNFNGRLNGIQALPETFFVDKKGNIVGETYSGARSYDDWKAIIEKELANLKNK